MAAYNTAAWTSAIGDLPAVAALYNTKLETLDETTGARIDGGIEPIANGLFQAWLIHKG